MTHLPHVTLNLKRVCADTRPMYGLVNQAVADLVATEWDDATWNAIRARAGIDEDRFIATHRYDDQVTYRLVEAASEVLGVDTQKILEAFGRHWILFTGAKGWGPTLDAAGDTLLEVLQNLDALHSRVSITMPGAQMPSFDVEQRDDNTLLVQYLSRRPGLAPMAVGLLQGLGERLGDPHEVAEVSASVSEGLHVHQFLASPSPA